MSNLTQATWITAEEQAELNRLTRSKLWVLPRRQVVGGHSFDSANAWNSRGFAVLQTLGDDLFYQAIPPRGWTRQINGRWLVVRDEAGVVRARAYIRLARMVRCAFVRFEV